jgi:Flp pilus assembly protein TadB
MISTLRQNAARAHYLWYTAVAGAFTLLFAVVAVRFTLGGVSFESFLLATLTFALAYQTRRSYRRFRSAGGGGAAPSHPDQSA